MRVRDDVIKSKHFFVKYWPFVRGIHRWWGKSTGHRWLPLTRPVTRRFGVLFDICLNKRLSKQSSRWWFEAPSRALWRHCNDHPTSCIHIANSLAIPSFPKPTLNQKSSDPTSPRTFSCSINVNNWFLVTWWRHQMEAFSALLALYAGNSPVTGEFPAQSDAEFLCFLLSAPE